jgi:hypothetical protein
VFSDYQPSDDEDKQQQPSPKKKFYFVDSTTGGGGSGGDGQSGSIPMTPPPSAPRRTGQVRGYVFVRFQYRELTLRTAAAFHAYDPHSSAPQQSLIRPLLCCRTSSNPAKSIVVFVPRQRPQQPKDCHRGHARTRERGRKNSPSPRRRTETTRSQTITSRTIGGRV